MEKFNAVEVSERLQACIIEGRKGKLPVKAHPDDAGLYTAVGC